MSNPKVLVAIPILNSVHPQFFASIMNLQAIPNMQITVKIGSLVYMARNSMAGEAINKGFDYIVWIDSDMVFKPDLVKRLVENTQHKRDFVSSICFRRRLPTEPVICKEIIYKKDADGNVIEHGQIPYADYPKNQTFEIAGGGFGCCITSTKMIEDVAEHFHVPPFDPMPFIGEDYSFCLRAKELGYKMWCDSRIKVGHVGEFVYDEGVWQSQVSE